MTVKEQSLAPLFLSHLNDHVAQLIEEPAEFSAYMATVSGTVFIMSDLGKRMNSCVPV